MRRNINNLSIGMTFLKKVIVYFKLNSILFIKVEDKKSQIKRLIKNHKYKKEEHICENKI